MLEQAKKYFLTSTTERLFVLHLRDPFLASILGNKSHFSIGVRTISHGFLSLKFSGKDNEIVRMQLQEFKFNMIIMKKYSVLHFYNLVQFAISFLEE